MQLKPNLLLFDSNILNVGKKIMSIEILNSSDIVKNLKGGFQASLWQGVAYLFDHNLKTIYDPNDKDARIEGIVREIEASGHFVVERI
jgi:hypothetical protein